MIHFIHWNRRRFAGLLLLVAMASSIAAAQRITATAVETPGFTVSNMDRSVDFYSTVLHFAKVSDRQVGESDRAKSEGVTGRTRVVRMQLGSEQIELSQYLDAPGRSFPPDSHGNDRWFQHVAIIVPDMDRAYAWLRENHVRYASNEPQRLPDWNVNAGGIRAFYFRDPDGHYLELLQFPEGKGSAKWHQPSDQLFLGIDHTAIVVADTEGSVHFYRDLLGMKVAGTSENYGTEQEHLNGVFGAHLRITALRAASGPGIELLEYLSPEDGRPAPADTRANDIVHWETRIDIAQGSTEAWRAMQASGATSAPANSLVGAGSEFLAQDPDRHVLVIHSPAP